MTPIDTQSIVLEQTEPNGSKSVSMPVDVGSIKLGDSETRLTASPPRETLWGKVRTALTLPRAAQDALSGLGPIKTAERVGEAVGKAVKVPEAGRDEATAKALNIKAISDITGLPAHEVESNYESIARMSDITGIQPDKPSNKEFLQGMMAPGIVAGAIADPLGTAAGLLAFGALDKLIPTEKFIPTNASNDARSAIELVDFLAKGAVVGGVFEKVHEFDTAKTGRDVLLAMHTQNKLKEMGLPEAITITPEQLGKLKAVEPEKNAEIVSAAIKLGNNVYEGDTHLAAMKKAEVAGENLKNFDRELEGMFKTSDGRLVTRDQAQKEFGIRNSHELIEQKKKAKPSVVTQIGLNPATVDHAIKNNLNMKVAAEKLLDVAQKPTWPQVKDALGVTESVEMEIPESPKEDIKIAGDESRKGESGAVNVAMFPGVNETSDFLKRSSEEAVKALSPADMDSFSKVGAEVFREKLGQMARTFDVMETSLARAKNLFNKRTNEQNIDFIDAMERGDTGFPMDPEVRDIAPVIREHLDTMRERIRALGKGKLENFIENYFPHIWKDPKKATDVFARIFGKRPLEGSKSFLKQRSIEFTKDGIAAGLEPVSYNPVDLTLLKAREMQKYLLAHETLKAFKEMGLSQYVPIGKRAPEGWVKINDNISTVYGSPEIHVSQFDDKGKYDALMEIAKKFGMEVETKAKMEALGMARYPNKIERRFGTSLGTLTHEIGHILDWKYNLAEKFVKDPATKKELRALADLRFEGETPSEYYKAYVRKAPEKMANMVDALINAPEKFQEVAPNTWKKLNAFINEHPELESLREVKGGVARKELPEGKFRVGGMVINGFHYSPESAAGLINNYLSPGLRGNYLFDLYRNSGNILNQFQLGISAFHLGFTSMDATVSRAALGINEILGGEPVKGTKSIMSSPFAPVTNIIKGDHLLKAWYGKPRNGEEALIANAMASGGGRARMDKFYSTKATENLLTSFREGKMVKGILKLPMAVVEQASKPIMEYVVPRQKMGVFYDLIKMEIERNPNMSHAELRTISQKAWDSVDNRMGQLVYDNLFWNKTTKDLAMASVRSVGWNLGTIRELGGGGLDIAKSMKDLAQGKKTKLSYRAAYVMALPMMVGLYGAVYQYMRTGKGPEELKDYFFPKNGNLDRDGNPARDALPSYMKDVYHYTQDPVRTVLNKFGPQNAALIQMLQNKDYYGTKIRNEDDPLIQQVVDDFKFLGEQFIPFGFRNLEKNKSKDMTSKVLPFVGITPAPFDINRTPAEKVASEIMTGKMPIGARTKAAAEKGKLKSELRNAAAKKEFSDLDQAVKDKKITPKEKLQIIKDANTKYLVRAVKRMTKEEALRVYEKASPEEKKMLEPIIKKKSGDIRPELKGKFDEIFS